MRASSFVNFVVCVGLLAACSANVDVFGPSGGGGDGAGLDVTSGQATGSPTTAPSSSNVTTTSVVASTSSGGRCVTGPDEDLDADGFSPSQGDCNNCDPAQSPNNFDVPENGIDDDCDGSIDELAEPCDATLTIDDDDAVMAAAAIEICETSSGPNAWGLVSAAWVLADGAPPLADFEDAFHLGHGLLDDFGDVIVPVAGSKLLALSNAVARDASDPGFVDPSSRGNKGYDADFPPGTPFPPVGCSSGGIASAPIDSIALEVTLRTPDNAEGFAFDASFFVADWPTYVCDQYDDTFFALLTPQPMGAPNGQIAFASDGNPMTLNAAPFDVCSCAAPPCLAGGKSYLCSQGDAALAGTGFEGNAATGWGMVGAPVPAGEEMTLRIGVYDGSDPIAGATAIVDGFRWLGGGIVPL